MNELFLEGLLLPILIVICSWFIFVASYIIGKRIAKRKGDE
jgi:uncharacterized protein YybS (DUF2232 family)